MKALLLAVLLVAALVTYAGAEPITMTFTDTGAIPGGSLVDGNTVSVGGRTVTNAPFTITVVSDTNNRITNSPSLGALFAGFSLDSIRASISIAELGTFDFITPTRVTLIASPNVVGGTVLFARTNNLDIYGGVTTVDLGRWDMLSSIGLQTETADTRASVMDLF